MSRQNTEQYAFLYNALTNTENSCNQSVKYSYIFFIISVVFCCISYASLIFDVQSHRSHPIEADDAYSYIAEAAQLLSSPLRDSLAMQDIYQQIGTYDKDNLQANAYRARLRNSIYALYTPGYSLLLIGLKSQGFSWEEAYNYLQLIIPSLTIILIAFWLHRFFGSFISGIALTLIGFTLFHEHGIHLSVPNNFALIPGIMLWSYILFSKKRSFLIILILMLCAISVHAIGTIYAGAGILLLLLGNIQKTNKIGWGKFIFLAALLLATYIIRQLPTFPYLNLKPIPFPAEWGIQTAIFDTFRGIVVAISKPNGFYSQTKNIYELIFNAVIFLAVCLAGLKGLVQPTKNKLLHMLLVLVAILFAQALYITPNYPALLFGRLITPLTILLYGVLARGLIVILYHVISFIKANGFFSKKKLAFCCYFIACILVFIMLADTLNNKIKNRQRIREELIHRYSDAPLTPELVTVFLQEAKSGEKFLYPNLLTIQYFISNGAQNFGAVYFPAINESAIENIWLDNDKNIRYTLIHSSHNNTIPQLNEKLGKIGEVEKILYDTEHSTMVKLKDKKTIKGSTSE